MDDIFIGKRDLRCSIRELLDSKIGAILQKVAKLPFGCIIQWIFEHRVSVEKRVVA